MSFSLKIGLLCSVISGISCNFINKLGDFEGKLKFSSEQTKKLQFDELLRL